MAAFNDLLKRVPDATLRGQLEEEYKRAMKNKKFGLVFEAHQPEFTPLYGVVLKEGMSAVVNGRKDADVLQVLSIKAGVANCYNAAQHAMEDHACSDLVAVAKFEDPIFPVLTSVDDIENAPGDPLWHTLIQADNYHALQLLEYMYRGKVDFIYLDPPYNSGASDWKYNNNYVDDNDTWSHSKWLAMMERRLQIASQLLNPSNSAMVVTIDDKEYLHLGMLLEQMFPHAKITMISSVINPAGKAKKGGVDFSRTDEYLYFLQIGDSGVIPEIRDAKLTPIAWETFRRHSLANGRGKHGIGACGPNQFYPIYVNVNTNRIEKFGDPIPENVSRFSVPQIKNCVAVFPVRDDGTEMNWGGLREEAERRYRSGYFRVGKRSKGAPQEYSIQYLTRGTIKAIEEGRVVIVGRAEDGSVNGYFPEGKPKVPTTNWNKPLHNATSYGTDIVNSILGGLRFDYPKSLYAVHDCLRIFLKNNPEALVLDFFAGSGTTLHAVNLLNAEDGGHRRCIMVTNNEVSAKEEKQLLEAGHKPGDDEWEALGIAKHVTWPRTKCSILGQDINGAPLGGEYQTNALCEKKLSRSYYHLGFVKDFFDLKADQKKKIVDLIGAPSGMKKLLKEDLNLPDSAQKIVSGAAMPKGVIDADCKFVVSTESTSSILFDATAVDEWIEALRETDQVADLYIVAEKKRMFDEIKAKVSAALGNVTVASTKTIPMSEGFKANVTFFKLDFTDKDSVRLGQQFKGILPILWMRSGAKGKCPVWNRAGEPEMLIKPENGFAVLVKYDKYAEFINAVNGDPKITDVYFVTNSEEDYREMCTELKRGKKPTHLYHSYLENFVIGCRRNAK